MIRLPDKYRTILQSDKPYVILKGGRLGGKSTGTAALSVLSELESPDTDVIVARVSYGSLRDSSYAEFESFIEGNGFSPLFAFRQSPLRIIRKGIDGRNMGCIYFIGYGGSNTSRTKSIHTKHKIKMVILEETQELKDKRNLDEALASFRRHFGEGVRVFILGNPPPVKAHWFNQFTEEKKQDSDYLVMDITWMDIVDFINDYDLKEILKAKRNAPDYYRWFYMGEPTGGFGTVYPMFRRDRHVITSAQFDRAIERGVRPIGAVIGGDGAVNNDATSFVPLIMLNNGQVAVGPIFYHNPKDDGVVGYHSLVQNDLTRWFDDVCNRFRLGTASDARAGMRAMPVIFRIDSAAPDLIQEVRYFLGDRAQVGPIQKHHVMEMVGIVQSAITTESIRIIDYGGYYSYRRNRWVDAPNVLAGQIESLLWNEMQTNYNPIIPNDVCDAFTYGVNFWFGNPENMQFLDAHRRQRNISKQIDELV